MGGNLRDLQHSIVHLLQGIDALLELNVVRGELGLSQHRQHRHHVSAFLAANMVSVSSQGEKHSPCLRLGPASP